MTSLIYFLILILPIVIVHELGHYAVGRFFGIQAEVFSIGFGKPLWQRRDKNGTLWQIALIPLGGYVKFAPDQNGASFPAFERDAPRYQASFAGKILTILAGPIANFIFSALVFFSIAWMHGLPSDQAVIARVNYVDLPLEAGDKITSVSGTPIETFADFYAAAAPLGEQITLGIERGDARIDISAINPLATYVTNVDPAMPAFKAGLRPGDHILSVNGIETLTVAQLGEAITQSGPGFLDLTFDRAGEKQEKRLTPEQTAEGRFVIGVGFAGIYETAVQKQSTPKALRYAVLTTGSVVGYSLVGIRDLITGVVGVEALSGPVQIAQSSAEFGARGIWDFLWFMGLISSAIGFMNLLPIPVLDGGHVVLLVYEKLIGRLPPERFMRLLFTFGLFILVSLFVYTTWRDLFLS